MTGDDKRAPSRSSPAYAVRAPLVRWLREEADRIARERRRVRVLDVGSGPKPYEPLFAPWAEAYVGVDPAGSDLVGTVEDLPVADASYDVVLCNQVLEHCADPARAVRELRRVTAPGGRVLASTHGVQVYHPAPDDLWRWTHTGLERLFRENGDWSAVSVRPGSGTAACVGMIVGTFMHLLAKRLGAAAAAKPGIAAVNAACEALDRRVPSLREPQPGTLFANYHVVAEVAA
ncbi:MAG TPA: class I SAM-dependent methyltransferase [Gaiellaceae bacterium]|nr:class I SAM-dependent methyltransferase [Gaiellaceae bacterium]